jgi:RNA polymerase sporulation-specific sigma factor
VQNLALQDAVARLNERERQIIRMRFYEGQTQMEVAREIGISQAQVSRLEKAALEQFRSK